MAEVCADQAQEVIGRTVNKPPSSNFWLIFLRGSHLPQEQPEEEWSLLTYTSISFPTNDRILFESCWVPQTGQSPLC